MSFIGKWMELEIIRLNKTSQVQKVQISYDLSHMQNLDLKICIYIYYHMTCLGQ
jgi:hypothetical protein